MGHSHGMKKRLDLVDAKGAECPLSCWNSNFIITAIPVVIFANWSMKYAGYFLLTHLECPRHKLLMH